MMELFPQDRAVGMFRGFSGQALEFHADLSLPYHADLHLLPMHGQFVIVELADEGEAILGRITSVSSEGRLASSAGEDYGLRALQEGREIPDDLREQYLKYRVDVRLLGVIRVNDKDEVTFAPSHRRLPHVGARVAFLSDELLQTLAGARGEGSDLGFFALGEFIYAGTDERLTRLPWMVVKRPDVVVKFPVEWLVARRSFVFARAGFGKSNLIKLLFAKLYETTPTVKKHRGDVPVGSVIFDPDGEYFWPDENGRPGLCDVPKLEEQLVVFTNRIGPSQFYGSFIAGRVKLDIRQLRPALVIGVALSPERQEHQNVHKLKSLNPSDWRALVDAVHHDGLGTPLPIFHQMLGLTPGNQDAEALAAKSNMVRIVNTLHDPQSQLLTGLLEGLRAGKLCVVDLSQMRGNAGLALSGIVLRYIFDNNQEQFTEAEPKTIPTIAVIEEAQSVLGGRSSAVSDDPYEAWVKEGRKYDLGAVMVTQQPGSIPHELLSQGDNWFIFHLLAAGDLDAVKRANAHFSNDLLSSLLNEPLAGNGVMWSSVGGTSYPIPLRALSFEATYERRDPGYKLPPITTFASRMREHREATLHAARQQLESADDVVDASLPAPAGESRTASDDAGTAAPLDPDTVWRETAIKAFREDSDLQSKIRENGIAWGAVMGCLKNAVPDDAFPDAGEWAYALVGPALDSVYGRGNWETERRPRASGEGTTVWVILKGVP
jgi:hypothetical protein